MVTPFWVQRSKIKSGTTKNSTKIIQEQFLLKYFGNNICWQNAAMYAQDISVELVQWEVALSFTIYIIHIVGGEDLETAVGGYHHPILSMAGTARATSRFTSMTQLYDTEIPCSWSIPICFLSRACPCRLRPRYRGKRVSRSLLCHTADVLTAWCVPLLVL